MEYALNNPIMLKYIKDLEEEYNRIINYIDVTDEWIKNAKPNSHSVLDKKYWIDGKFIYHVDGKNVVLDYSDEEKECAKWLEDTFGGEIFMCPRVNSPEGIETPDYLFRGEKWELKTPIGNSKSVIDNQIKGKSTQASNFIIDITNNNLSTGSLLIQVQRIYSSLRRNWVDKIIVKKDKEVICVYKRKNEATEAQMGHDRSH